MEEVEGLRECGDVDGRNLQLLQRSGDDDVQHARNSSIILGT